MTNLDVKDKRETKTNLEVKDEIEFFLMEHKTDYLRDKKLEQ